MKSIKKRTFLILGAVLLIAIVGAGIWYWRDNKVSQWTLDQARSLSPDWQKPGEYWETAKYHTPNLHEGKNDVKAVVLHHTAGWGPAEIIAEDLCRPGRGASCHVVIDTDGTRYVLAEPDEIPFHAGYSRWAGRFRVNNFSIGIEFQGNTLVRPLTDEQIESAIEYLRPIIRKYKIPAKNIVTHQMVRDAYMKAIPGNKKALPKADITPTEYERVMNALDTAKLLIKRIK